MKERVVWVDVAKGLAMLLIIWGHVVQWAPFRALMQGIDFFHVPVWVLLSALFLKPSEAFLPMIRKKAARLLKPYYIYGALVMLVHTMNAAKCENILLGGRQGGAIWFLPMLFSTMLLAWYVLRLRGWAQVAFCAVAVGSAWALSWQNVRLPFNLEVALYMLPFFVTGQRWRKNILHHTYRLRWAMLCLMALVGAGVAAAYFPVLGVNFYDFALGFLPLTMWLGACGIYVVFYASMFVSRWKNGLVCRALTYIGAHSMVFLLLHQKLCFELLPLRRLSMLPPAVIDFIALGVVLTFCALMAKIIHKYLRFTLQ